VTPANLEEQLVRDEDEILHAYQDSEGYWTIGVGTLIDARKGGGITREESRYLLNNRITRVQAQVRSHLPWTISLDEVRRAVLENMCFNEGIEHLLGFHKMLAAIQVGNWTAAAAEGLHSLWAKEVGDRAHRLMTQLELGQWV
jgi:lysozyme